jgi:hypothetical protein
VSPLVWERRLGFPLESPDLVRWLPGWKLNQSIGTSLISQVKEADVSLYFMSPFKSRQAADAEFTLYVTTIERFNPVCQGAIIILHVFSYVLSGLHNAYRAIS